LRLLIGGTPDRHPGNGWGLGSDRPEVVALPDPGPRLGLEGRVPAQGPDRRSGIGHSRERPDPVSLDPPKATSPDLHDSVHWLPRPSLRHPTVILDGSAP